MPKQRQKEELAMYLAEIQYSIIDINDFIFGLSEADFCSSRVHVRATCQALSQIGETCNKIKNNYPHFIEKYPIIPWRELYDLRNVFSHHYDIVKPQKTWNNIQNNFPALKEGFQKILENEPELKEIVQIGVDIYFSKYLENAKQEE